jgi:Tol biopolymer transport system component
MFNVSANALRRQSCAAIAIVIAACTAAPAPTSTPVPTTPSPSVATAPTPSPSLETEPPTAAPRSPSGATDCDDEVARLDGRLAFQTIAGRAAGIATLNADGTDFQQVVEPGDQRDQPHFGTETPRWTADGRLIFSSNRAGGMDDWHIFVVDGEGGDPAQLTGSPDGIEYHGVMSPDGRSLVYAKAIASPGEPDPFREAGIFISDADGDNERQVTTAPEGAVDEHPDVSPDGTRIAFSRGLGGSPGNARGSIYVVNVDGTGLQQLTDPELDAIRPRWSSDGSLIVFSSNDDNFAVESANVWLVASDGTGLRQVTHESADGQAYFPDWSPDDQHLAFLHHVAGGSTLDVDVRSVDSGTPCTLWRGTSALAPGDPDWGASEAIR